MKAALLTHRGIIRLSGDDRSDFLQGLVSNDVRQITSEQALYATFLTPQGKFLYDLMITEEDEAWLIEAEQDRLETLLKKLSLYKLRSKVFLEKGPADSHIVALWGDDLSARFPPLKSLGGMTRIENSLLYRDPRLKELGYRAIVPASRLDSFLSSLEADLSPYADFEDHRLKLGIPEGEHDLIPEKSVLLECGLDELNAINWQKGCYIGQELTARTRYRGLIRKRLLPITFSTSNIKMGDILNQDDQEVGEVRSVGKGIALAMIRLEALSREIPITCGGFVVTPYIPDWVRLPE
jgi:folate-binding protein YgfZ